MRLLQLLMDINLTIQKGMLLLSPSFGGRSTPGEPQLNEKEHNWKQLDNILAHYRNPFGFSRASN